VGSSSLSDLFVWFDSFMLGCRSDCSRSIDGSKEFIACCDWSHGVGVDDSWIAFVLTIDYVG
ncbi:hypothetical protein A2U01_0064140, partial [Trifolium medium]|nr:hypothetical protein [Trifolium medium]